MLTGSLIKKGLVDELLVYISPKLLGDQARPMVANICPESLELSPSLKLAEIVQIGTDIRLRFLPIS
ncbi:dihydrofolate reductase family protein [Xenorhabdus sp. VLS]|uniref:Dihydrofolate reductase family protein n=1 Tax=Xenorhabdus lircayensis TaxID=2763499 RepID=A0ABS0UDS4_9GAMM|nr:dihydrofolate reductase family protein [Xenorhabdus lircayensis]